MKKNNNTNNIRKNIFFTIGSVFLIVGIFSLLLTVGFTSLNNVTPLEYFNTKKTYEEAKIVTQERAMLSNLQVTISPMDTSEEDVTSLLKRFQEYDSRVSVEYFSKDNLPGRVAPFFMFASKDEEYLYSEKEEILEIFDSSDEIQIVESLFKTKRGSLQIIETDSPSTNKTMQSPVVPAASLTAENYISETVGPQITHDEDGAYYVLGSNKRKITDAIIRDINSQGGDATGEYFYLEPIFSENKRFVLFSTWFHPSEGDIGYYVYDIEHNTKERLIADNESIILSDLGLSHFPRSTFFEAYWDKNIVRSKFLVGDSVHYDGSTNCFSGFMSESIDERMPHKMKIDINSTTGGEDLSSHIICSAL